MVGYAPRPAGPRGGRLRVALRGARGRAASPQPPAPLGDLEPAGDGEEGDVVDRRLRRRRRGRGDASSPRPGSTCVVLEAGPYVDRDSYPTDPLEALPLLYRDGGLTIAEGRPPIPMPVGRAVGGTTVINSGTCFRAPERGARATGASEHGIAWATDLDARLRRGRGDARR